MAEEVGPYTPPPLSPCWCVYVGNRQWQGEAGAAGALPVNHPADTVPMTFPQARRLADSIGKPARVVERDRSIADFDTPAYEKEGE